MDFDYAVHSDFLIHWTGRDIDNKYEPDWYDAPRRKMAQEVTDAYVRRIQNVLEYGLWMTEEPAFKLRFDVDTVTVPPVTRTCFTELRLSLSMRHAKQYGRLGLGVKRPFLFDRRGRPLVYFGRSIERHNDGWPGCAFSNRRPSVADPREWKAADHHGSIGRPVRDCRRVVSLSCRLIFDFAVWSDRGRMPPVLLVCEEAHRYVPADERIGFSATARAITRIAREGRKYGVSLALISQRPSELSAQALSQCGTIFALRLANELDQRFMETVMPDAARGNLATLSSLGTQEAIVCGDGVPLPMRIRFDDLPRARRPRSEGADFAKAWQTDSADAAFRDEGVRRWRQQSRKRLAI
jgi:hypothetical protein